MSGFTALLCIFHNGSLPQNSEAPHKIEASSVGSSTRGPTLDEPGPASRLAREGKFIPVALSGLAIPARLLDEGQPPAAALAPTTIAAIRASTARACRYLIRVVMTWCLLALISHL